MVADAFGAPATDKYASPLLHPRLKDLKKVYLAVASHDTLRDDGTLMKQKLDEAGSVLYTALSSTANAN
jgi:versiconal hemiacetal acetate esterase